MDTLRILMGAVVLILGRKLYWLFVGAVGFVLGISYPLSPGPASSSRLRDSARRPQGCCSSRCSSRGLRFRLA